MGSSTLAPKANKEPTDVPAPTGVALEWNGSEAAAGTTPQVQRIDPREATQSKVQPQTVLASERAFPGEGATPPVRIQAFLEHLPEIQKQLLEAETAPRKALAEFRAELKPIEMELRPPFRALRDDYEEIDKMVDGYRASKRPGGRGRFWIVVITLGLIIAEALINGSFLAVGEEGGLIAGWLIAAGISFVNVGLLGFFLGGFFFRQCHYRRFHRWLFGALGLCAVLAVAYSSNLLVAHYRDALGGPDPDNAGAAALAAWLANPVNPLQVNGVQSLWLLGLGIAFTLAGLGHGYLWDDPYPGYGKLYKEHVRRQAAYQSLYKTGFDALRGVEKAQSSQLAELADEINRRLNDFLSLRGRYASKPEDPDFAAWKQIEEGFPEARVNSVLIELASKKIEILNEYTSAMSKLQALDPTTDSDS